jgi:hypothetical protein
MPLIARTPGHHTIRHFHRAARQRYNEAESLATSGNRLGAIYLCGYAAEMILKAAYFRLKGWLPNAPIALINLQNARSHAIVVLGLTWSGNLHDLTGWCDLLIHERHRLGFPYPTIFRQGLSSRVRQLMDNWRPELRYHTNRPFVGEVRKTLGAVRWLFAQSSSL